MRIDPLRISQSPQVRRVDEREAAPRRGSTGSPVDDTTDLLAISAGVRVARERDILVDQLREAYRSGVLRPDSERIADRLLQWGFDLRGEELS